MGASPVFLKEHVVIFLVFLFLVKQLRLHPQHTLCHSVFVFAFAGPDDVGLPFAI